MERKILTDEQQDSWDRLLAQSNKIIGLSNGLSFMEEKFGLVNIHVIEYRKEYIIECGIVDILENECDELGVTLMLI